MVANEPLVGDGPRPPTCVQLCAEPASLAAEDGGPPLQSPCQPPRPQDSNAMLILRTESEALAFIGMTNGWRN